MKLHRSLSLLLCLALLLGAVTSTGVIPAAATDAQNTEYDIEGTTNADKVIAVEDNILTGAVGSCTYHYSATEIRTVTPPSDLYDGLLGGVGNGTTNYWRPIEKNKESFWVTYELDDTYDIDSFLVAGGGHYDLAAGCGIYSLQVYVGYATATEIKANTAGYTPVYTTEDDIIFGRRVDLAKAVRGSKVVFCFGGYTYGNANAGQIWMTEIAAMGALANSDDTVTDIKQGTNVDKIIAVEDNILANAVGSCTYQHSDTEIRTVSPPSHLCDGLLGGIGSGTTNYWRPIERNKAPFWVTYELGSNYEIDSFLVAGAGHYDLSAGCGIYSLRVYVGDATAADIKANTAAYTPVYATEDDIIFGRRVDLANPVRGSKIVFCFGGYTYGNANAGQIWLTELAATGTRALTEFTATELTADTTPADANLLADVIPAEADGRLVYALDREYTIDRLLVKGDSVENVTIWICNSTGWNGVPQNAARAVKYVNAEGYNGLLFTLDTPVTGRYVVIETAAGAQLGAYAASAQEIGSSAHAAMLPVGDNLLVGIKPLVYNAAKAVAVTSGKAVTEKDLLAKVQAEYLKATDGLMTGLNVNGDSYKMSYPQYDGRGAARVQVYYDIKKSMPIQQILLAVSGADKPASRLNGYKLYLSDRLDTLFDEASCVADRNDNGLNLAVVHSVDKTARYFGFEIQTGEYDQVRLAEIGLYTAPVAAGQVPAIKDVASTATVVKKPLTAVNLLAGKQPLNTAGSNSWDKATDGILPGVADADGGKTAVTVTPDSWTQITYDLGKIYDLDSVLVGNSLEESTLYRLRWGKVYVSDTLDNLYDAANLAVDYTAVNKQAFTIALDGVVGRYVGFSFYALPANGKYGEREYADWNGHIRIGELGVYGELYVDSIPVVEIAGTADADKLPNGDNLLADAAPVLPFGGAFDTTAAADRLTDGVIGGMTDVANTDTATFTGNTLVYDLAGEVEIEQILVAHPLTMATTARTPRYQVFVGYDQQKVFAQENLVLDYSVAAGGYNAAQVFTLPKSVFGTVVGIRFVGGPEGKVSLTELGVYGAAPSYSAALLNSEADADKVPTGDNLLDGLKVLDAQGGQMAPETPASLATDGIIYGVTQPLPGDNDPDNKMTLRGANQIQFVYDLGVKADISHLLLAAGAKDEEKYRITGATFYFSDSLSDLFNATPMRVEFTGSIGMVLTMNNLRARYVGVSIPVAGNWYDRVRVGEIGVFGTLLGTPAVDNRVNLIAGKEPVDTYVTDREKPDRYNEDRSGWLEDSVPDVDTIRNMTDGDYNNRHAIFCTSLSRLPNAADRYYISLDTPWAVYIYHLGGTATVEQIDMTSTGESGNYQLGGVDYYVGQNLKTLFDAENRVYTTHGEKTIDDESGKLVHDPDYDVHNRVIRAILDTPKTGRYVALVVTRPHTVDRKGYSQARISEFEVFGSLDPANIEKFPETTFTDPETGSTLTLKPYNYDDVDLYNRIAGLKVTKVACPKDMQFVAGDNWLMVRPSERYIYQFDLVDKNGKALSDADYGTRVMDITMPNQTGEVQVLGAVDADGVLNRVVNARTNDGVLYGEKVKSRRLVRLVMNESLVDWNGVTELDNAQTVEGAAAQVANALAWLWVLPVAALLLAAVLWVAHRRRVR